MKNKMISAVCMIFMTAQLGCTFSESAFVCTNGSTDNGRVCEAGVWVGASESDTGENDSSNNCQPEPVSAFCFRLKKRCGSVAAPDICGNDREVDCGNCDIGLTCGGGGFANQCGDPGDAEYCVAQGAECGSILSEDGSREIICGECGDAKCNTDTMVCECDDGFRLSNRSCVDIDECAEQTDDCDDPSQECVNDVVPFRCQCAPGYERNGDACVSVEVVLQTRRFTVDVDDDTATVATAGIFTDSAYVVPFLSAQMTGTDGDSRDVTFDVKVEENEVQLVRDGTRGVAKVGIELVEFNPERTRIQTGTFEMNGNEGFADSDLGTQINLNSSFVVFYVSSTSSSANRDNSFISATLTQNSVEFDRDGTGADISGTFWVIESLRNDFSVQHLSIDEMTENLERVEAQYDVDSTLLLYSYQTFANGSAGDGHLGCHLAENSVECLRRSSNEDIRDVRLQLISGDTFQTLSEQNLMDNQTAFFGSDFEEFRSTVIVGRIGTVGVTVSDISGSDIDETYVLGTYDGNQVSLIRSGDEGPAIAYWQLIEW